MTDMLINGDVSDQEIENFDRLRHAVYEALVRELQHAVSAPESADFGRIMARAQQVLGRTDAQMSSLFKVSRPTVGRWTRGVTAPHVMLRKAAFDTLMIEAKHALKSLRTPA